MNGILLRKVVSAAKDIAENFKEDPAEAKRELEYRLDMFLRPPPIVAGECEDGCCMAVHVEKRNLEPEMIDAVCYTLKQIRNQEFPDEPDPSASTISNETPSVA